MERKGEFVSAVPRIAQLLLLMKNIPGDWGFDCCISYGDLEFSAKEEGVLFSAKANFQNHPESFRERENHPGKIALLFPRSDPSSLQAE